MHSLLQQNKETNFKSATYVTFETIRLDCKLGAYKTKTFYKLGDFVYDSCFSSLDKKATSFKSILKQNHKKEDAICSRRVVETRIK